MKSFFNNNPVIKIGIIAGFLLILNEVTLYGINGENPYIGERTSSWAFIGLLIPVIATITAILILRKRANFTSFGQIIKPGIIIGFLTAVVYIAYTLLFVYNIEPNTLNEFEVMNKERLLATGQFTPESEDLNNAVQLAKNAFLPGTILFSIAINLFIGFITAIITAIFIRNKQ